MQQIGNMIHNNGLGGLISQAGARVSSAVENASKATGVDFAYLMQQASAESSFDVDVKAKTSSASGLFQFIEKTWMGMVEKYGDKYGIDAGQSKQDLLELRNDPEAASLMAAEFAAENKQYLENSGVKDIGSTELYFAHFLGAKGASEFLKSWQAQPEANAGELFPKAANANKNIFFNRDGSSKTLEEVYTFFDRKFSIEDVGVTDASVEHGKAKNYVSGFTHDKTVVDFVMRDDFAENAPKMGRGWSAMWQQLLDSQDKIARDLELLMLAQEQLK